MTDVLVAVNQHDWTDADGVAHRIVPGDPLDPAMPDYAYLVAREGSGGCVTRGAFWAMEEQDAQNVMVGLMRQQAKLDEAKAEAQAVIDALAARRRGA